MNEITHLWNITKHLTELEGEAANSFRMYYVQKCKQLTTELEQLPKTHFGPSVMCSHCGSLWSKNELKVKIEPGKTCSKSVKQIIRATKHNSISRFRATLLKKSLKNQTNKVVMTCSVCSKKTIVNCNKPTRPKPQIKGISKGQPDTLGNVPVSRRKKKKKAKDKTAGLNISGIQSPSVDRKEVASTSNSTPVIRLKQKKKELTPLQKVRKLNLNKLNNMLNDSKSKPRNSISNFLNELY